jgi:hypothetical protein
VKACRATCYTTARAEGQIAVPIKCGISIKAELFITQRHARERLPTVRITQTPVSASQGGDAPSARHEDDISSIESVAHILYDLIAETVQGKTWKLWLRLRHKPGTTPPRHDALGPAILGELNTRLLHRACASQRSLSSVVVVDATAVQAHICPNIQTVRRMSITFMCKPGRASLIVDDEVTEHTIKDHRHACECHS